jgi:hypothetical protein
MSSSNPVDMVSAIQTANLVLDHARHYEPQLQSLLHFLYCDLNGTSPNKELTVEQSVAGFFTMTAAGILGGLEPSPHRVEALQALGLARAAVERAWASRGT